MKKINRIATIISGAIGGGTFVSTIWELVAHGGILLDARAQPEFAGPTTIVLLLAWGGSAFLVALTR